MNLELRDTLVHQADAAFLQLTEQANVLLDAAHVYLSRNPSFEEQYMFKPRELKSAVSEIGTLTKMLAAEIARWKKGEARMLSRMGVELNILDELYANMESMLWFYTRETIEVPGFSLDLVRASHSDLLRCNRLL